MTDLPTRPREWTLTVCPICGNHLTGFSLCSHQKGGDGATGIDFDNMVPMRVLEAEPVGRERDELLDVLEGLLVKKRLSPDAADAGVDLLRKYGRLSA
jgi:hypothetical protein